MHHPLDWLVDEDKIAIEKCISGFDIVLNGHIHETDTKVYTTYNGQTIFIPPVLSKYSEYEKETIFDDKDESAPSLDEICNGMDNILLLGKKEIGKTTLLHYISKYSMSNFNVLHRVPLIIDCLHIDFAGKNTIARAAFQFVNILHRVEQKKWGHFTRFAR